MATAPTSSIEVRSVELLPVIDVNI